MVDDSPIVFLDIDGVLNTSKNYAAWNAAWNEAVSRGDVQDSRWHDPASDQRAHLLFDDDHISVLNRLTDETGARVVVSSTWRSFYHPDFDPLRQLLRKKGVKAEVIGPTPVYIGRRYDAVWAWLAANRKGTQASFVCLDDEEPNVGRDPRQVIKRLCLIDREKGFQEDDIPRALKRLKDKLRVS